MCGIAGGFHLSSERLDRMLDTLRHRGPDGDGRFQRGSFHCGMTRLAILDLENGQQPFCSSDGAIHAICNGEIYNWSELRSELEAKGHRFQTQCDCEILPAAWREWGSALPEKLNGMFALAIHDSESDSLFLARDRCGQKPLYYYESGDDFVFASEIKALRAAGVPIEVDPSQLPTYLYHRYLPEPLTLLHQIHSLPPAHSLTIRPDREPQLTRYWSPPLQAPSEHFPASVDELDHIVRSAVELALQSDVPIACYLSAGVDSSLLAWYARDLGAEMTTISLGFQSRIDECDAAAKFAKSLGYQHLSSNLTPASLENLPRVIHQMDRPVADLLILAFDQLASHTHSLGIKVALGGEGPDEHFAGYGFHRTFHAAERLGRVGRQFAATTLSATPTCLLDHVARFPASLGAEGRRKVARYFREYTRLGHAERITRMHSLFEPFEISQILTFHSKTQPEAPSNSPASQLDQALASQYDAWLPSWSLIRQDKNTMAHSLEYRSPFLDHRLIDFSFRLPADQKLKGSQDKILWRQLAKRHLPTEVANMPKIPFYLPIESPNWSQPFLKLAREVLSPQAIAKHGYFRQDAIDTLLCGKSFLPLKQLAALVIFQLWYDNITDVPAAVI